MPSALLVPPSLIPVKKYTVHRQRLTFTDGKFNEIHSSQGPPTCSRWFRAVVFVWNQERGRCNVQRPGPSNRMDYCVPYRILWTYRYPFFVLLLSSMVLRHIGSICPYLDSDVDHKTHARIALILTVLHYTKREFETLFVHRFRYIARINLCNATMPIRNLPKNSFHYWGIE